MQQGLGVPFGTGSRPADGAQEVSTADAASIPNAVEGEILPPESCDAEVAEMMERLSRLQTWLVMQCCQRRGDPEFRAAIGLIQDVRVLIVERCFRR